uniref:Uncharacterized protein n=1 Tax=Nelumbo nucifera TaxID=4432 RepID=A0A822Y883_NELNU|nr:TPA_asm: hypothetical protein HUJ06_028987 [Nelumbo nucifera]
MDVGEDEVTMKLMVYQSTEIISVMLIMNPNRRAREAQRHNHNQRSWLHRRPGKRGGSTVLGRLSIESCSTDNDNANGGWRSKSVQNGRKKSAGGENIQSNQRPLNLSSSNDKSSAEYGNDHGENGLLRLETPHECTLVAGNLRHRRGSSQGLRQCSDSVERTR